MLESHPAARKPAVSLRDFRKDGWVLFAKRVHPLAYDSIQETARQIGITPKVIHEVITPADAFHHVIEGIGVAVLTRFRERHMDTIWEVRPSSRVRRDHKYRSTS